MSAGIGEFAKHVLDVSFGEGNPQGGIGFHFGEALADFAFLRSGEGGGLLDFYPDSFGPVG